MSLKALEGQATLNTASLIGTGHLQGDSTQVHHTNALEGNVLVVRGMCKS